MLSYYIFYPILYTISLLPMWVLYGFASFFKFILFDIIGYRKKVILTNLRNSFPEKSEEEILKIANNFYRYFCDLILEVIKSLSISYKELERRVFIDEVFLELMRGYERQGKSVIVAMGHHGNWEWSGNAYSVKSSHDFYGIFRPLHNKGFNKIVLKVRTRFNTKLISDKEVSNTLTSIAEHKTKASIISFITDQSPSGKSMYWTQFLNQETPVFWGVERYAKKFDFPVVYVNIVKVKRGYYKVEARTLVEHPESTAPGEISELHTRAIEQDIIAQPETWLWTHKRWKRKKSDYEKD